MFFPSHQRHAGHRVKKLIPSAGVRKIHVYGEGSLLSSILEIHHSPPGPGSLQVLVHSDAGRARFSEPFLSASHGSRPFIGPLIGCSKEPGGGEADITPLFWMDRRSRMKLDNPRKVPELASVRVRTQTPGSLVPVPRLGPTFLHSCRDRVSKQVGKA